MNYLVNNPMEFAEVSKVKQPSGGLKLESPEERDYILGALVTNFVKQKTNRYRDLLPKIELQRNKNGDTYLCVTFSLNNVHEILYRIQYGTEINFSELFVGIGSGSVRGQGNGKRTVAEWKRKNGFVWEEDYPYTLEMTLDQVYQALTKELLEKGKQNLSLYEFGYQWLPSNSPQQLLEGLWYSPLQVDVERYSFNDKGYIVNSGTGYIHEVVIFDYEEGKCWWVFDSESNQFLKFDWNYNFGSPMIHSLKKKNMAKIYKKKGEPALYFLNPKDQKLVSFSDGVITGGDLFKTLFVEYYFEEFDELPYPVADYSIKTV